MTAETITGNADTDSLSDRQLLERVAKQLDHLDGMLHEVHRTHVELAPLLPLVPRALALLDPGAAMRRAMKPRGRGSAVPPNGT